MIYFRRRSKQISGKLFAPIAFALQRRMSSTEMSATWEGGGGAGAGGMECVGKGKGGCGMPATRDKLAEVCI